MLYYLKIIQIIIILHLLPKKCSLIYLEPEVPKINSKFRIIGLEHNVNYSISRYLTKDKFIENICHFKSVDKMIFEIPCECTLRFGGSSNFYKIFKQKELLLEFFAVENEARMNFFNFSLIKLIQDEHYLLSPLKVRLKSKKTFEKDLCLNFNTNNIQIQLELKYRPFEFLPRSILKGTLRELDYDELDGSTQISLMNLTLNNNFEEITQNVEFDCSNFLRVGYYAVKILQNQSNQYVS